jgi:menaquinone-dependent protoporphyrinogen IX oxidase
MKNILVTYATNAGSTADVAALVKDSLSGKEISVDLKPVGEVGTISAYGAVIVGAPMIVGWHRAAKKFLKDHRSELANKPFACFLTAMSLTETRETAIEGVPIQVDPGLAKAPRNPKFLSIKEGYALPANYVRPILRSAPGLRPLGVGLFGGYLNLLTLSWPARLFVLLVIQAKPGSMKNEAFVKDWSLAIRKQLLKSWLK